MSSCMFSRCQGEMERRTLSTPGGSIPGFLQHLSEVKKPFRRQVKCPQGQQSNSTRPRSTLKIIENLHTQQSLSPTTTRTTFYVLFLSCPNFFARFPRSSMSIRLGDLSQSASSAWTGVVPIFTRRWQHCRR